MHFEKCGRVDIAPRPDACDAGAVQPLVSAIILNYRSPRDTARCAKALRAQTIADRIEILAVDNHSDDESAQLIRNLLRGEPSVRVLESPVNGGYGKGNTFAAGYASGEYLLIINPDNELEPSALERMVLRMKADPGIGILAPKLVHEDGTVRDSFRAFPRLLDVVAKRTALRRLLPGRVARYLRADADLSMERDVDWVVGACLLLKRSFYEELGGFDERFFLFFEDMDLCRRCWDPGDRVVYFPAPVPRDRKTRLSEGGIRRLLLTAVGRAHVASGLKYFWKWRSKPLPRLAGNN